jgi:hypothetical protein
VTVLCVCVRRRFGSLGKVPSCIFRESAVLYFICLSLPWLSSSRREKQLGSLALSKLFGFIEGGGESDAVTAVEIGFHKSPESANESNCICFLSCLYMLRSDRER